MKMRSKNLLQKVRVTSLLTNPSLFWLLAALIVIFMLAIAAPGYDCAPPMCGG